MTTKIKWADMKINPIVGCSPCSPGCNKCKAKRIAARLAKNPKTAAKYVGVVDEQGKWTGKINNSTMWNDSNTPHRVSGKNKRVFVGSMTDLFHPNVSRESLDEIFASILFDHIVTNGHRHTYIVLTKRADRMLDYFSPGPEAMLRRWGNAGNGWLHVGDGDEYFSEYAEGQTIPQPGHKRHPNLRHEYLWPLPNAWLGVTVCNQAEADEKIPLLLDTPAAKRFVSVAPCLGPVDLGKWLFPPEGTGVSYGGLSEEVAGPPLLDWVICGGETGPRPRVRPLHPDWVRNLRDQCQAAGTPFFFKGWGEWKTFYDRDRDDPDWRRCPSANNDKTRYLNLVGGFGFHGERVVAVRRVGKRRAGRLLDRREWCEVPEVKA